MVPSWKPLDSLGPSGQKKRKKNSMDLFFLSNLPVQEPEVIDFLLGENVKKFILKVIPLGTGQNRRKAYVMSQCAIHVPVM